MTSDGQQSADGLRDYLRTLKPEARALLVAELERGLLRGEGVAGNDLVLQELHRAMRSAGQPPAPRVGDAARMFFAPLEPFLTDDVADHKRIGRLARVSLDPIWEWIGRDLMPAEAKALTADINGALSADDRTKAEQLTRALQERAVQRIRGAIAAVEGNEKARRRLAVQVGTPRALDDLATVARVLAIRDILGELVRRLPERMRAFEHEHADAVKALLNSATSPRSPEAARKVDVFLYGLILVMSRLEAPWQLIRVASRAAESDDTARVSETPFAVAVTVVLSELECMVRELRRYLKEHHRVTSLLKSLHDAARVLRTELDLSVDSPWSRQLTAIRTEISNLLKTELESAPGRVRRLLRPRPAKEIVPGSLLDAIDVSDAEMLVELVGACRHYASELAINEVTMRSYAELRQYLETGTKVLLDTLRQAGDGDRPFRQSQVEAAVRFCRTMFGADYAGLLAKAAEMAVQAGSADRKPVRA
jgi:hypothetical protein